MIMPFKPPSLTKIYERWIKKPLEEKGNIVKRGDDFYKPDIIMNDILDSIESADVIIADLTNRNANVFYELGIAHAKDKWVILICQNVTDIPFDLRHLRTITYNESQEGGEDLKEKISQYINIYIEQSVKNKKT